jgi:type I restriction enzyme S subunit
MDKWKKKKLGDIAPTITKGTTPTTNGFNFQKSGIGFVKIENINKGIVDKSTIEAYISEEAHLAQSRSILQTDDLLFSIAGTIGKIALVKESDLPLNTNQALAIIRGYTDEVLPEFLGYTLVSSVLNETVNKARGGALQNISLTDLKNAEIIYPSSKIEQRRIVSKLDTLFEKADKSIQLLEENLNLSKALLLSVLDEEFSSLKCNQVSIGQLLEKTQNLNPISEFKNDEFTYIDITSINNSLYKIENPKTLKGKDAPSRAKKIVEFGDVIFATTRPNLKNIAIVNESYYNPIASTGFCVLRTKNTKLLNEYLFYFLTSQKVQELIVPFIKGAQYPAISDKDLLSIQIPLPDSIDEQKKIISRIKFLTDKTNSLVKEIQIKLDNMKALKSSLLDQVFKGEL